MFFVEAQIEALPGAQPRADVGAFVDRRRLMQRGSTGRKEHDRQ
jgi:hypothetical protein